MSQRLGPIITIVRAAEAEHDVVYQYDGENIRDPGLTENGRHQAQQLYNMFPNRHTVRRLFSSPMRRAVQTAVQGNTPVTLVPELCMPTHRPCDTGRPWDDIRLEFGVAVDLDLLYEGNWWRDTSDNIAERARVARVYLRWVTRDLADHEQVIVYTHQNMIDELIFSAPALRHAEFRYCRFTEPNMGENMAYLHEIETPVLGAPGGSLGLGLPAGYGPPVTYRNRDAGPPEIVDPNDVNVMVQGRQAEVANALAEAMSTRIARGPLIPRSIRHGPNFNRPDDSDRPLGRSLLGFRIDDYGSDNGANSNGSPRQRR
ncbi:histidine phosphatase superfamily [Nemania sp. FL0031]|nr:histidine phosphatase superfamily [Nemania sp. FL0031]